MLFLDYDTGLPGWEGEVCPLFAMDGITLYRSVRHTYMLLNNYRVSLGEIVLCVQTETQRYDEYKDQKEGLHTNRWLAPPRLQSDSLLLELVVILFSNASR